MARDRCRTCELLKELYRLKLNQFQLAARSASAWSKNGLAVREDAAQVMKRESLDALSALIQHANACYGLVADKAA